MNLEEPENYFVYYAPSENQIERISVIRHAARHLASEIDAVVPDCADKTAAIRKLRECIMTANAAIVIPNEK